MLAIEAGVAENVNVRPLSSETTSDIGTDESTAKSDATPAVAPRSSETDTVQTMVKLTRAGLIFVHAKADEVVG